MENTVENAQTPGLLAYTPESAILEQNFVKIPSTTTCNGKIHKHIRYCKKPAGWGTDHPGKGRCKLHGGCCTGPKSGQLRYSDFVPTSLIEKYEEFAVESDKDIKSLDNEIALIRAKIAVLEDKNNTGEYDKLIGNFVELIRRLVETKQNVEEGKKSKVTVEVVVRVIDSVIDVIDRNVPDLTLKKTLANELRRLNFSELGLNDLN